MVEHDERVSLWLFNWTALNGFDATLWTWLSEAERARAMAYYRQIDQQRSLRVYAVLRCLLSDLLACSPGEVELVRSANGKPHLHTRHASRIKFNLSHSGDYALFGISSEHEIGIDIEQGLPMEGIELIAEQMFSPHELAMLLSVEGDQRQRLFYRLWVRKEAYLKYLGTGLMSPPQQVDVSGDDVCIEGVKIEDVEVANPYFAACVTVGTSWTPTLEVFPLARLFHHIP